MYSLFNEYWILNGNFISLRLKILKMDTVTIPKDEYQKMMVLIDSLKSIISRNKIKDDKELPVVWSEKPDTTALFSLTDNDSRLVLSDIRKTWKRES